MHKPLTDYYKHKQMEDGHLNICKECTKKRVTTHRDENIDRIREYDRNRPNAAERAERHLERQHKLKEENPELYREKKKQVNQRYYDSNPMRPLARAAVYKAIRRGTLVKPDRCERCGTVGPVEGHHWSYEKEHRLDVEWLCDPCHKAEHVRLNELARKD